MSVIKRLGYQVLLVLALSLTGCQSKIENIEESSNEVEVTVNEDTSVEPEKEVPNIEKEETARMIQMQVNNEVFNVELENNETVEALIQLLPMDIRLQDMNGNEFYNYLPDQLPNNSTSVKEVQAGDMMLYGDDCLVIFYKSFQTSYSYTRLGHMENITDFKDALDNGNGLLSLSLVA